MAVFHVPACWHGLYFDTKNARIGSFRLLLLCMANDYCLYGVQVCHSLSRSKSQQWERDSATLCRHSLATTMSVELFTQEPQSRFTEMMYLLSLKIPFWEALNFFKPQTLPLHDSLNRRLGSSGRKSLVEQHFAAVLIPCVAIVGSD